MCDNFWQPYATPYQTRYNAPQQAFGSKLEVIRVNGKNGAEAFQMPPNSSIILLDESAPRSGSPDAENEQRAAGFSLRKRPKKTQ